MARRLQLEIQKCRFYVTTIYVYPSAGATIRQAINSRGSRCRHKLSRVLGVTARRQQRMRAAICAFYAVEHWGAGRVTSYITWSHCVRPSGVVPSWLARFDWHVPLFSAIAAIYLRGRSPVSERWGTVAAIHNGELWIASPYSVSTVRLIDDRSCLYRPRDRQRHST